MQVPGGRSWIRAEAASLHHSHSHSKPDPNRICDLLCSLWQLQILNPLREARDETRILMDTSSVLNPLSTRGTTLKSCLKVLVLILPWGGRWRRTQGSPLGRGIIGDRCLMGLTWWHKGASVRDSREGEWGKGVAPPPTTTTKLLPTLCQTSEGQGFNLIRVVFLRDLLSASRTQTVLSCHFDGANHP